MSEINKEIIFKWIETAFNMYIKPHYDDIKKNNDELIKLKKFTGLDTITVEVKDHNSLLNMIREVHTNYIMNNKEKKWFIEQIEKMKAEYESLNADFIELASLVKKILNTPEVVTIPTIFNKSKFLADIIALNKQMDSRGEKELPKRENGLNHSHGINSETSVSDSKLPETCKFYKEEFCEPCKSPANFNECDLVKIGNQIIFDKFVEQLPEPEPKTPEPDCKDCVIKESGCQESVVCMFFKPKPPIKSLIEEQYKKQMERQ